MDDGSSGPPRDNGTWRVGDATVTRIDELTLDGFGLAQLFPDADPAHLARHRDRFGPGSVRAGTDKLVVSTHSWLLRMGRHVVLVDTAVGNGKHRPKMPTFDQLDGPYLQRLAAAGLQPGDVDHVLITHLHSDHVGWNTRLQDGRWVPTFPRARYVFSAAEQAYDAALADGQEPAPPTALGPRVRLPAEGMYDDSVRPVLDAGLAHLIDVGGDGGAGAVPDGLRFVASPGHSVDHACIRLVSRGEEALFAGDVLHHPLQVHEPDLCSCFCEFPAASKASRKTVLADAAARGALVFTSHFAESSAGRVTRVADGYAWRFEAPQQASA